MTFLVAFGVFVLDRLTKIAIVNNFSYGQSVDILPKIFNLTLVFNTGTAFGLVKGQNAVLAVFAAIIITVITIYVLTNKNLTLKISLPLGLILGGALGNLFDRVRFGHVIDFLDFQIWPVFNAADSAITIGVIILTLFLCIRSS